MNVSAIRWKCFVTYQVVRWLWYILVEISIHIHYNTPDFIKNELRTESCVSLSRLYKSLLSASQLLHNPHLLHPLHPFCVRPMPLLGAFLCIKKVSMENVKAKATYEAASLCIQ